MSAIGASLDFQTSKKVNFLQLPHMPIPNVELLSGAIGVADSDWRRLFAWVVTASWHLNAKEALTLDRTTLIGLVVGSALFVAILVNPATTGPRESRAELRNASISIEDIYRKVEHTRLPIQSVPEP
jgi:hypothetical protein